MDGVKENPSYHDSRHTFGTLMLSAGIPIESISKMMGHTNIRNYIVESTNKCEIIKIV